MARGKGKVRRKSQKSTQNARNSKLKGKKNKSTNGRDIKHRDQYKRSLPGNDRTLDNLKRRKIQEESFDEESEEEKDPYKLLLSTFTQNESKSKVSVESEDEVEDEASDLSETDDHNLNSTREEENDPLESGSFDEDDVEACGKILLSKLRRNKEKDLVEKLEDAEGRNSPEEDSLEEDSQEEDSEEEEDIIISNTASESRMEDDPFVAHICYDLSDEAVELMSKPKPPVSETGIHWKSVGRISVTIPEIPEEAFINKPSVLQVTLEEPKKYAQRGKVPAPILEIDWELLQVKTQLRDNVSRANAQNLESVKECDTLTPLQLELFTLINNYQDVYFPKRSISNGEQVRLTYCLHAANHVIKTRNKVMHHNAKINKKDCVTIPDEFRDQGLVRPKVLILVPFREQARRVVETLIKLLIPEESKGGIMNRNRFDEEFTGQELIMPKSNPRPEDYEALFAGNTDDTFRIGLSLTKKCLKLYSDFYSSDIIISSPLGIRMIIGAEGEAGRDYDFLASIEILIIDQADVFLMQNWDHLLHVMDHLHLQPRESHGTDFSRVRSWALSGWAKYYRQTLLFSSVALPECSALFTKRCRNYSGSIRIVNPITSGTICHVVVQLPQVFHRINATSASLALDSRFDYFTKKILPEHLDPFMTHTMIYVPSYFDYVRLRNHLRKEGHSFVQICEYSKDSKVARARDMFFHSQVQFLLYSERFHFFRRPRMKGIRHIVFYQPPNVPHFYSEMCNLMQESNQNPYGGSESNMTVTVLYSKFDAQQLAAVVGSERASRMLSSDRNVHMFMTGE